MSVINKLASQLNINGAEPNIKLAHELACEENHAGIEEIIENLANKNKRIQSDCIKVAYEIGQVKPELIRQYGQNFLELLKSRNNRLIWGGMSALATIADLIPDIIMIHLDLVKNTIIEGSAITVDRGIITLAKLAAVSKENNDLISPFLIQHLKNCESKEIPPHSESILCAITDENKTEFLNVLREREDELTAPQLKRVKKIYNQLAA